LTLVRLAAPLDISSSLELFKRSGDDLIDRWDGRRLVRVLVVEGRTLPFVAVHVGTLDAPGFEVTPSDQAVLEAAATTFVPPPPDYAALLDQDAILRDLDARFPGVRQIRQLDLFTALVRCISAQQVNLRWAVTTRRRLAENFGTRHEVDGHTVYSLDPERLARVAPEQIRALQFTMSKAHFIVAVARAIADGRVALNDLERMDNEAVVARLIEIRGIGRWSAEWVLARTLGRACVVAGDLGVRKAVGLAYLGTATPSEAQVRQATAHWGASAGTAQALLLHALGEGVLGARLTTSLLSGG
jgi:DNA-3-methyladenine glycosylase II